MTNNAVLFYSVVATKQKKKKEKEDAIKIEDVTGAGLLYPLLPLTLLADSWAPGRS